MDENDLISSVARTGRSKYRYRAGQTSVNEFILTIVFMANESQPSSRAVSPKKKNPLLML
jgi:hypothetical protein